MEKNVLISIKGIQKEGNEPNQPIEVIAPGTLVEKEGSTYLLYDEHSEGENGITKNVVKIGEEEFSIRKTGETNVHMLFSRGKKHLTSYTTPFGIIIAGIETGRYEVARSEQELKVIVEYDLDLNYEKYASCRIEMTVKPKEQGRSLFHQG